MQERVNRRVLVVDDEENLRLMLRTLLRKGGYEVEVAASGQEALARLEQGGIDFVLTDLRMPRMGGLELLREAQGRGVGATFVVMSAYGSLDLAVDAMKAGAYDYISKPFKPDEIILTLRKAEERESLTRENTKLRAQLERSVRSDEIISRSRQMLEILRTVGKVAEYKSTVLVSGESGTGKELIARAVHRLSPRANGPFVAVNCGAIPETLLESELFGHKKGAFTDANADKRGLFEEATGGTHFLAEVGELPMPLQVKLLRVLQEETIRKLGDTRDTKIDVRIVAATMRDLGREVAEGRFREDLFYRLNVLPIHLPPLRDRREDIPPLLDHFVGQTNKRLGTHVRGIDPDAMKMLLEYGWPGNVREVENTIERAMVLAEGDMIRVADLPEKLSESSDPVKMTLQSGELSVKKTTRIIEEILIRRALHRTGGNRTRAAELLELSHRALLYKIKDYGIA